jgi:hypothetical protein
VFNRSGVGHPREDARLSIEHDWVRVQSPDGSQGYALSIMGRALNLRAYGNAVRDVYEILRTSLEFEHYSPRDQQRTRARWAEIATPEEGWILDQSTGRVKEA